MAPLLVALGSRVLVALYHRFIATVPLGGADAETFERRAWEWAQSGCGNLGEHLNLGGSYVHTWLIANVYACTDRLPLVFQLVNVGLGVATVYLVARIAEELWDREAAARAAWIAALYPLFIIYSAIPLREVWFTAFFLLSVLWVVRWIRTWRLLYLMGSVGVMLLAAVVHGSAIFALGAVGLVVMGWGGWELVRGACTGHVKAGIFVGALMLGGSAVVGIIAFGDARFSSIGKVGALTERADALDERAERARGGSAFPGYLVPSNDLEIFVLTPVRMANVLFGPPPWEVRIPRHALGALDGLFYLVVIILLMRYRALWWKKKEFRILLVLFLFVSVILAWGVNNYGTGMRHRAKFLGMLIAMAAGLLGQHRRLKRAGKMAR